MAREWIIEIVLVALFLVGLLLYEIYRWVAAVANYTATNVLVNLEYYGKLMDPRQLAKAIGRKQIWIVKALSSLVVQGCVYITNSTSGLNTGPYSENALYDITEKGRERIQNRF